MAVSHKARRFLAFGALAVVLGFVAACGDDDGAIPGGQITTGSILGRVTDTAGAGIVGATVGTTPGTSIALTDANGNYRIDNVAAGSYAVTASKEGFASASVSVTVTAGDEVTAPTIVLTSLGPGVVDTLGTVTGLVTRANGQPAPEGTIVNVFRDASSCTDAGTPTASDATDAGGRFLIEDLPAGAYIACVETTIGGQEFLGRTGFVINAGEITEANITIGRDLDQTTDPNIGGELIELDANGKFEGTISFFDVDGDGDPNADCNVIFTQHLWVVEVTDAAGDLVSGVRVEWALNQAGGGVAVTDPVTGEVVFIRGTTGVIVDTDDPFLDPVQAEAAKRTDAGATPQFKVDATHAVTYTNDSDQEIDFGGETVTVGVGQTWIIVTSPIEGFTDVVASSPDLSRATSAEADKDFAIKRWVNWRIEVAELDVVDTTGALAAGTIAADGDTISNRLDRTPQAPGGADCSLGVPGARCILNNRAFFGVVISRFRLDSPFTFLAGSVEVSVDDDDPDVDILDIDSDEGPGTISADRNFGAADFTIDAEVTFVCNPDPLNPGECLDVDVVLGNTPQSLSDIGFTISSPTEVAAVAVTAELDTLAFFATTDPASPVGFTFNDQLQALIEGRRDLASALTFTIFDEFGEVCDEITVTKRWVSSVLLLFKSGPAVVELDEQFEYTVTVVNDGEDQSNDVIIADTLPILDVATAGDRAGGQAFRYVTDDPTFDPDGIRYYVDAFDDDGGTLVDFCIQAPSPLPVGFPEPAECNTGGDAAIPSQNFATIAEARAAAEGASDDGDQIVIVEYFDLDILARTQPGGPIEAEDSFEITLEAIQSINNFRIGGALPGSGDPNFEWCNIASVTSAENDFAADSVCTTVLEALLEVRKTVDDAVVPAGDQVEFTIEIGNNGSADLVNVTVSDTLDAGFLNPATGDPGLVQEEDLCEGCTISFNADSTIITINVPAVPPTDDDSDGVFDDDEGFLVATLVVRTPLAQGTFCNRVTVADEAGRSDTDIACVVTQVEIEFDIVNTDGLIVNGAFTDVETFEVGDTVAYQTLITNRSDVAATNVNVLWEIAPEFGILDLLSATPDLEDPASISCSTTTDSCTVTVASLAPDASVALNYRALAQFQGNDVNRITLTANELSLPVVNEEPTTVNP